MRLNHGHQLLEPTVAPPFTMTHQSLRIGGVDEFRNRLEATSGTSSITLSDQDKGQLEVGHWGTRVGIEGTSARFGSRPKIAVFLAERGCYKLTFHQQRIFLQT